MAERLRGVEESGGTMALSAECKVAFVDTSLGTHIAMLVSGSDTVLDFKKKIVLEHGKCFPKLGEIRIHSLKVKRKWNFYHLPDFMLVCSALSGVKGNWFLSADASSSLIHQINQKSYGCGTEDQNVGFPSGANEILTMTLPDGVVEENVVPEITAAQDVEKYSDKMANVQINNSVVKSLEPRSPAKRKRTLRYDEDVQVGTTLVDGNLDRGAPENKRVSKKRKFQSLNDQVTNTKHSSDCGKKDWSFVSNAPEFTENVALSEPSGIPEKIVAQVSLKDMKDTGNGCLDNFMHLDPSTLPNLEACTRNQYETEKTESILSANKFDLNVRSRKDRELSVDHQLREFEICDAVKASNSLSRMINPNLTGENTESSCSTRKKRKVRKAIAVIPDVSDAEPKSMKDDVIGVHIKTSEAERMDGKSELPLNHGFVAMLPLDNNSFSGGGPIIKEKEVEPISEMFGKNSIEELEISHNGRRKKKKVKKSAAINLGKSGIEHSGFDIDILDSKEELAEPSLNHDPKRMLCQKSQISTGGEISFLLPTEKESQVETLGTNLTDKSSDAAHNKIKKVKKKSKSRPVASGVPETSLIKNLEVGMEVYASNKVANSEQESRNVESSLVLPHGSEEKLEKISNGDGRSFLPCTENESQVESFDTNQPERTCENAHIRNKKAKKKSKRQPIASDAPENVLIKDQEVGVTTNEVGNTEQENRNVDAFPVMSHRSKEKLHEMSAGDELPFLPAKDKEKQVETVESNQTEKTNENVRRMDKKVKNNSKRQSIASDVPENMLVNNQEVGLEIHAVSKVANTEQESRNVDSSRVLSEKRIPGPNIDDLVGTKENNDEEIDFRRHFLARQKQDKVAAVDKIEEAMTLNVDNKTGKNCDMNSVPSERNSDGSQNSLASFVSKNAKNKASSRMANGRKDGDSTVFSDHNGNIPTSTRKSVRVAGDGVKNSSPSDIKGRSTLRKHDENPASTPLPKEKNTASKKLIPEISGFSSDERTLNSSDAVVMKIPEKSSLLTQSGSIFQDFSGESSGDDVGTGISDDSTCSPSDSSSQSGSSAGESDSTMPQQEMDLIMQKEDLTEGKDNSDLDSPDSGEITMGMILRGSKRFQKAKVTASQNDLDLNDSPIEFVSESWTNQ